MKVQGTTGSTIGFRMGVTGRLSAMSRLAVAAQLLALARLRNAAPVICAIQESLKGDGGLSSAAGQLGSRCATPDPANCGQASVGSSPRWDLQGR
jgi:hypothetical protein